MKRAPSNSYEAHTCISVLDCGRPPRLVLSQTATSYPLPIQARHRPSGYVPECRRSKLLKADLLLSRLQPTLGQKVATIQGAHDPSTSEMERSEGRYADRERTRNVQPDDVL